MTTEQSPVKVKESAVLDKWEGDPEDESSVIIERLWVEDGNIVAHATATDDEPLLPFEPGNPPAVPVGKA